MQVGEAVDVNVISDQHDSECYFCNSNEEPLDEENDLDDEDIDGMESAGIKFHNSSSKLGTACGGDQGRRQAKVGAKSYPASTAAHHLIPGNAALKNSELMDHLHTQGKAKGNIGYNVNSAPNGVWLPGNYAIRPWGKHGVDSRVDPTEYAYAAIDVWHGQFHDAHKDYNDFVLSALDKIAAKLDDGKKLWCPKAKKQDDDPTKRSPLYVLVNRLHTVSGRMRKMLVFPTKHWKSNIFTSSLALSYIQNRPHHD